MRILLAVLVVISMPLASAAQSGSKTGTSLPALPPIGLPLSPIGLPLAPIGLPTAAPTATADPKANHSGRHDGRRPDRRGGIRHKPSFVYFVPAYDWPLSTVWEPADETAIAASSAPPAPPTTMGWLQLDVEPDVDVQVVVDGYFAGTLAELGGEIEIGAGVHRIELRAGGYETQIVDVRITASRTISYRTALLPLAPADQPASNPPVPRTTIYFIPGCYLGNVPPSEASLPAGCDLSQLTIRKP